MSTSLQASDASRRPPSALSCTDSPFRHGSDSPTSPAKSGDASAMEELLRPLIVIKPHPPKLTVKPRALQPLMLLPRQNLRLSFLDLSSPYGSFEASASFEANIRILDFESRMGNRPVVLIARLESNRSLYAIERAANNLYTLCHLSIGIDLPQLGSVAIASCAALICEQPVTTTEPPRRVPLTTPQISSANNKRRMAIEAIQSLVRKPARSRSMSIISQAGETSRPPTPIQVGSIIDAGDAVTTQATPLPNTSAIGGVVELQVALLPEQKEALVIPDAEGIFANIRNQYLEALYHSMGSLAYFAKGPLSRARAAFHLDCDSTLEMNDLVDFLKGLVLTTTQVDKKYRETIPKIQSQMKTAFEDSDVEQAQAQGKPKKRKAKKMKLGKDALYPGEIDHVRKWWTNHKPVIQDDGESTTKSTEQQEIKLQISLLRSRETQLQMIIILEILSLEPLAARESANIVQLPGLLTAEESLDTLSELPAKKRNKHDLPTLLEVHADRLCIWQSIAFEEMSALNESQIVSQPELRKSSRPASDTLKDFCVDIIMPFFSAKLPECCDSINRKLGGPVMMSPPKSAQKTPVAISKTSSKPGAASKRPVSSRSHRTLEIFLSKETEKTRRSMSRGPGGVIALMRSASTSTGPFIKREASEPRSLMSLPGADTNASREKLLPPAGPLSTTRRVQTKERKDAFVKAELQDAISTLRRPNRDIVGKSMAEADERRATTTLSQMRKSKKPTQHNRFQGVVKATPAGSRFHDALARENNSQPAPLRYNTARDEQALPSSSMVPSSAPRKRNREIAFGREQMAIPVLDVSASDQIVETPARSSTLNRNLLSAPQPDEGLVLASSPLMPRRISQPSFVTKTTRPRTLGHRDSGIELPSSPGGPSIFGETPIKARQTTNPMASMDHYVTVTPIKKRILGTSGAVPVIGRDVSSNEAENDNNPKKKMSIFERLGWDDDYDELE